MDKERESITHLFREVAADYLRHGKLLGFEIFQVKKDTHAFYRLYHDPTKVIHIQGYPGMSSEAQARVYARMMDYEKMTDIRALGHVSVGNEHAAVTQQFPNFGGGISINYDPKQLEAKLEENIRELSAS